MTHRFDCIKYDENSAEKQAKFSRSNIIMKLYRKKPVEVYAYQFTVPDYIEGTTRDVDYFRDPDISGEKTCEHCGNIMRNHGWINTLEGGHIVCPNDFIITGVKGEKYPCKPDIFEMTYECVEGKNLQ